MKSSSNHLGGAALASTLLLGLSACEGQLAVVDTLDTTAANLTSYRTDSPTINAPCACASSESLKPLICGGGEVPLLDNDIIQTTSDGNIVAFNLCDELVDCRVIYWDGGYAELPIASGLLLGLSASGAHVLASGDGTGPQLIDLNGTTAIPIDPAPGRGALSARGDTVVGAVYPDGVGHLARVSVNTGQLELIGELGRGASLARAYVNPDASAVVGFRAVLDLSHEQREALEVEEAFVWTEQGFALGLPGTPAGAISWPEAVSDDGTVIAGRSRPQDVHFRWSKGGGYVELASASWRSATFLSADGSVVLGTLDPQGEHDSVAFRWTEATGVVELTPGVASIATDMSDDGSVILATSWEEEQLSGAAPRETFIWDSANGARTLADILEARNVDTSGWQFAHARVLSGNGKVLLGRGQCGGVPTLYRVVLSD